MSAARWPIALLLLLLLILAAMIAWLWPVIGQIVDPSRPRSFYIPSESMLPTLQVDDRVRPRLPGVGEPRRGEVVVVSATSGVRVARVIGVGGDRVQMRAGRLWLNGAAVPVRDIGAGPVRDGEPTRVQRERLPDERGSHRLLDAGPSSGDDTKEARVPRHHLFLLGDNRDRAADSRFSPDQQGLAFVPRQAVLGIVDQLLTGARPSDMGRPIGAAGRP